MAVFTDVITIYNHYFNEDGADCWKRTVVKGVQLRHGKRELAMSGKTQTEEVVNSITIDFQKNYGNLPFVESKHFKGDAIYLTWTLNCEDGLDLVLEGNIEKEIGPEYSFNDLKEEYECYTVKSIADNRNRDFLKNIKVVAY